VAEPEDTHSQTEREGVADPEQDQKNLTDQVVINKYNAIILAEVTEVFSGVDYLGSGLLKIKQQQGKLKVSPLRVSMPSGNVSIDFSMEPDGDDRHFAIDTHIEELDYGIVGRWFKPDTDLAGVINVRSSLYGESPDYQDFMSHASGYIDVSLQPEKIRSGVIDLWAVNLFSYLIPFFSQKQ
jgi:hypothetical protein